MEVDQSWTLKMFLWSVIGALAGMYWPIAVGFWRRERKRMNDALRPAGGAGMPAARRRRQLPIVRWAKLLAAAVVLPVVRMGGRIASVLLISLVIACVASAVGFAAFLQNAEARAQLQEIGALAFFAAFNYGFTASSLVEGAMRQTDSP